MSNIDYRHVSLYNVVRAAGLVTLTDLSPIATRTSQAGAAFLDALVLAPGMHCQQSACDQPACTTNCNGFRMVSSTQDVPLIKNPAIVRYFQPIARPGHIVTTRISPHPFYNAKLSRRKRHLQSFFVTGVPATLLYLLCPTLSITAAVFLGTRRDWRGLGVLVMFIVSRLINVVVVRRRSIRREVARELSGEGEILVSLSQDRWIRLRGMLDDLKIIASRQWREKSAIEGYFVSFATLLVYAAVILSSSASTAGILTISCLLLCSSAILGLCNVLTQCLQVFDCVVYMEGEPEKYSERNTTIDGMLDKA
ncbi:hypothetical protein ARMGADRAFT_971643 [Armillaria gallica]|uniref:Uncharacterized protein n=1 Tax=Armillaria gallica TaxID=47427 RepID=A0A2H3CXA4_ARMGA|nr:hypothetical protein ARMGADRAFT_971643 [Armillaria gallica]